MWNWMGLRNYFLKYATWLSETAGNNRTHNNTSWDTDIIWWDAITTMKQKITFEEEEEEDDDEEGEEEDSPLKLRQISRYLHTEYLQYLSPRAGRSWRRRAETRMTVSRRRTCSPPPLLTGAGAGWCAPPASSATWSWTASRKKNN